MFIWLGSVLWVLANRAIWVSYPQTLNVSVPYMLIVYRNKIIAASRTDIPGGMSANKGSCVWPLRHVRLMSYDRYSAREYNTVLRTDWQQRFQEPS